jgi:hypothetical protein
VQPQKERKNEIILTSTNNQDRSTGLESTASHSGNAAVPKSFLDAENIVRKNKNKKYRGKPKR